MPLVGRKPKPEGQAVTRHKSPIDWVDVEDAPFVGGAKLPKNRPSGKVWSAYTRQWWRVVSSMPHCSLWYDGDWQFALDTAVIAADFHDGEMRLATEVRNRERVLGTTVDFRRDLRIRYVPVAVEEDVLPANVTNLDDFRDVLD